MSPAPSPIPARFDRVEVGDTTDATRAPPASLAFPAVHASPASLAAPPALLALPALPAPLRDDSGDSSYTAIKLGIFEGSGDVSQLDTGFYGELVFGRELLSFLAIEGVIGYLDADGNGTDVWGIPLFVQARASVPIVVVEPYAGLGIGGFYVDASASPSFASASDFVGAANAFLGVEFGLGSLAVGIEGKYLITQEVDSLFELEGTSVMLTGTVPF